LKTPDTHCPLDLSKWRITLIDAQNESCIDSSALDVHGPVVWDYLLLAAVLSYDVVEMRVEPLPDASVDASLYSNSGIVICGLEGMLTYLLDSGAQVNAITEIGKRSCTPLLVAIAERNMPALKVLLDRDADVNQIVGSRATPLLMALYAEDETQNGEMVKLLLKHGADVNFADDEGCTALMRMAKDVDFCMMDLLLEAGADMEAVNLDGQNARQISAQVYRDHFTAPDGGDPMQHKLFATGSWSCVTLGMELWATGYWGAPCGSGHDGLDLPALLNEALSQGKSGMAREFLVARSLFGPENFDPLIGLSSHLKQAVNALDWKMIDVLREFGADIDAPVGRGITSRELATDALSRQVIEPLQKNEGVARAGAVDGLLEKQLAFASCGSHTELEATLEIFLRHMHSPLVPSACCSSTVATDSATITTNAKHLNANVGADDLVLVDVSFCLDDWNEDSACSPTAGTDDDSATHGLVEALVDDDSNIAVPEYLGLPAGEPML